MISMEREALDSITRNGGRLHYYLIAEELSISSHYAYVICKGLERNGYIDVDTFRGICSLTGKGKEVVERNWLFELENKRKHAQEKIKRNKEKISKNVETINY